jgi:hypothetical protein
MGYGKSRRRLVVCQGKLILKLASRCGRVEPLTVMPTSEQPFRRHIGLSCAPSPPPSRLAQAIKHMFVLFGSKPRRAAPDMEIETLWRDGDRFT